MPNKMIPNLPDASTPWIAKWQDMDSAKWIKSIYAKSGTARDFWGVGYRGNNKETILVLTMQILRLVKCNEDINDLVWFKGMAIDFKIEYDAAWEKENNADNTGYYKLDRSSALFADADNILNMILDYNFVL